MSRGKAWMILVIAIVAIVLLVNFASFGQEKGKVKKEGYVGSETCEGCHPDVFTAFKKDPHWGKECESCHGPGEKHAEAEGKGFIFSFKDKNAAARPDVCLQCHEKIKTFFQFGRSVHKLSAVGCTNCHGVHEGRATEHLLIKNDPDLCFSCHGDVKSKFYLSHRHPVLQGALKCGDCHTPHGTRNRASLRKTNTTVKYEVCFNCHPEKRGPWVYEHLTQKVEGCSMCHVPHGSPNKFLLNFRSAREVCSQCHGIPHFATASCINCHTQIHGSNFSSRFLQ